MELLQSSAKPSIRNPLKKPFLLLQNNLRSRFQHGWIEVCLYKDYALSSPDGGKSAKKPRVQKGYHCSRNAYMLVYTQRTTEGRYAYQLNSLGPSEAIWQQRSGYWAWYLINNERFGGVGYIIKKLNHGLVFLMRLAINIYIDSASKDYFLHEQPWISLWISNITIVSLLWRYQKSIVTSSAERRPSEWDTGMMCKDHCFYRHLCIRYVM